MVGSNQVSKEDRFGDLDPETLGSEDRDGVPYFPRANDGAHMEMLYHSGGFRWKVFPDQCTLVKKSEVPTIEIQVRAPRSPSPAHEFFCGSVLSGVVNDVSGEGLKVVVNDELPEGVRGLLSSVHACRTRWGNQSSKTPKAATDTPLQGV